MTIPIMKPVMNKEMEEAAIDVLENEKLVLGESVYKFEKKFAEYIGTKYAVSTSSGTMALFLALNAAGIKKDNVITTTMSFIATANAILHNNSNPVFCDINEKTGNIDVSKIMPKDAKAIIPVHLYGNVCDMDRIMELKENSKTDLVVIEDACQAHGATYNQKKAGSFGDAGCFSFYSTKNMTVGGDGGIVTTNNEEIANSIRKLTDCGRISRYEHDVIGYTARLNTVNAAIGLVQLKFLDLWNKKRRKIAEIYKENLTPEIQLDYNSGCVYYTYTIKLRNRDSVAKHLEKNGIQTGIYFPIPIHLQPVYKKLFNYEEGAFPAAERFSKEILSLPMFPEMKEDEARLVCEKVNEALEKEEDNLGK